MVALAHASNVTGAVQPVGELAAVCRGAGALLVLDACQTATLHPLDAAADGDLVLTGGHKGPAGPPGVGLMYVGERAEPHLAPVLTGGTGGGTGGAMPAGLPGRYEPGTPNVPAAAGLLAALEHAHRQSVPARRAAVETLTARLLGRLAGLPGVRVLGPADAARRCGLVTFAPPGWDPAEAAAVLDASFDVQCRAGLHCAPGAHRRFGTLREDDGGGAVRLSVGPGTTVEDVDAAADAVAALLG